MSWNRSLVLGVMMGLGLGWNGCKPVHSSSQVKVLGSEKSESGPVRSSTVALVLLKPDGTKGQVFCSGVVITSDAVLTAAQCLDSLKDANSPKWAVLLDLPSLAAPQLIPAAASTMTFSANGTRDYPGLNMAVIRTAAAAIPIATETTPGYIAAEVLRSPAGLQNQTEVLIGGYGRQYKNCLDVSRCSGVLYEAKASIDSFQDQNHLLSTVLIQAKQDKGLLCSGDAGGPAFVQVGDRYYLAGIANGGLRRGLSELSTGRPNSGCESGIAAFSFPGDYLNWLDKTAGVKVAEPSAENLARSTVPVLENPSAVARPANIQSWTDWLAFTLFTDAAYGTVSILQQKLLEVEATRTPRLSDLDFYLKPLAASQKVQALTELVLKGGSPLASLDPLAAFQGLTKLEIDATAITDFSFLSTLTNLTSLSISGSADTTLALAKLDSLGALSKLQTLELDHVGTETLRGLDVSKLTSLRTLTLIGNGQPIFIPKPSALDALIISNADLSDPTLLDGLPLSLTTLKITSSKIGSKVVSPNVSSAAFVATLANLKILDLSGNQIADFTRIADLKKLTSVLAPGNPAINKVCGTPAAVVCEYSQVVNPVTLEDYCINYVFQDASKTAYATAIGALAQNVSLPIPASSSDCAKLHARMRLKSKLSLTGTGGFGAVDLSPIASIRSLTELSLKNFGVVDVAPLKKLTNLKVLDLSQNLILDPKPLEGLTSLYELILSKNLIASMNAFSHPTLQRLTVDSNKLVGMDTFGPLPELRFLSCANMPGFRDVKAAGRMGHLEELNVGKTDVTDLATLEPAVGLKIEAPDVAVRNGCPVLLGTCTSSDSTTSVPRSGSVPGVKPGQQIQENPTPAVDLPGMALQVKL